ncbi:MAG: HAD family hydrolase [Desulfobacterales bacterium]|nr:HAD family hydrolase [Desulfobacterales bacterium]
MSNIEVIVFDCDGVMFDTEQANMAYYNEVLFHMNRPGLTPEEFQFAHMHTSDEVLARLFKKKDEYDAAQAYRKTMRYEDFFQYMDIEPGLVPLLEKLQLSYKIAIATNRADTMEKMLKRYKIETYFDLVVTALDVEKPKPDPEELFRILKHFNVTPEEMLYVGDSKLDELAAKGAGVPLIAYRNKTLEAAYYISRLSEIEEIVGV